MSITTDKLVSGLKHFDSVVFHAADRANWDRHTASDVGVLWAKDRIKELEAENAKVCRREDIDDYLSRTGEGLSIKAYIINLEEENARLKSPLTIGKARLKIRKMSRLTPPEAET
jgi:hypothetical protein